MSNFRPIYVGTARNEVIARRLRKPKRTVPSPVALQTVARFTAGVDAGELARQSNVTPSAIYQRIRRACRAGARALRHRAPERHGRYVDLSQLAI